MKKNKGQMIGQVFVYILAIVIFATIMIFGYKAVTSFLKKGEQVGYIQFKTSVEKAVRDVAGDFGSVRVYNSKNILGVPAQFKEICFVNFDYEKNGNPTRPTPCTKPLICDVWGTLENEEKAGADETKRWERVEQNVFTNPLGESPIKTFRIQLTEDGTNRVPILCFPQGDKHRLDIQIEGKGKYALIKNITG